MKKRNYKAKLREMEEFYRDVNEETIEELTSLLRAEWKEKEILNTEVESVEAALREKEVTITYLEGRLNELQNKK